MKHDILVLILIGLLPFFMSEIKGQLPANNGESVKPDWWLVGSVPEVGSHWSNPFQTGTNTTASV